MSKLSHMLDSYSSFGRYLKSAGKVAIAYSGGFDSTFMLIAASEFIPSDYVAIFVDTPMISEHQKRNAITIAEKLKAPLIITKLDWTDMPNVMNNDVSRCYFCKLAIYGEVRSIASDMDCKICICGDNYDDLKSDRPGRKAVEELKICKPLEDLNIPRTEIVNKVRSIDLGCTILKDTCLSTRIPTGIPISEESIRDIESYEKAIRYMCGVQQVRFRFFNDHANIQTSPSEIDILIKNRSELEKYFLEREITIDIDPNGYNG
jgi:pyridinium-3,5-biscarboxylic acid mononucleotide sulfurtransferase